MTTQLKGKRALVTGASRGLGVYIAKRLAAEGIDLVLVARDASKLENTERACRALGVDVQLVAADVTRADDRKRLLDEAGDLDVLVNNAGVEFTLRLVDQSEEEVRAQLETNLAAPIDLIRRALPGMISRGQGVIVNVSSMSGKAATPWNSVYAATKHGLVGLSTSLDIELHGTGVHVGVVCPGFVAEAGMWADTGQKAPAAMREVPPERVADAVVEVIRGKVEVLVTPGPMRPLLALRAMIPAMEGPMLRVMGIAKVLSGRATR